jgi:hypothetical protein
MSQGHDTRSYFKTFFSPVCHSERSEESSLSNNLDPSLALRVTKKTGFEIAFSVMLHKSYGD